MKMTEKHKSKLSNIGEFCKTVRALRGYTQQDVAKEIAVPLADIINFENGRTNNAYILWWYIGTDLEENGYDDKRDNET